MNLYDYQRSKSFIDLHPRSLRFTFSNFFSLENSRPIGAKFHVEPPWNRGMKVYSNGLCHLTSMATMPIYGKNLKKFSSLEPKGQWPWKLVCSIRYSSTSKFIQMMTLSWPWPILWQGQIWSLMLLYGEKGKLMNFSETVVVYDIKVGRFNLLMSRWTIINKVKVIHWTSSKVTQIQYFQSSFAQKPLGRLKPNFIWIVHEMWGTKICSNVPGHMTMPI